MKWRNAPSYEMKEWWWSDKVVTWMQTICAIVWNEGMRHHMKWRNAPSYEMKECAIIWNEGMRHHMKWRNAPSYEMKEWWRSDEVVTWTRTITRRNVVQRQRKELTGCADLCADFSQQDVGASLVYTYWTACTYQSRGPNRNWQNKLNSLTNSLQRTSVATAVHARSDKAAHRINSVFTYILMHFFENESAWWRQSVFLKRASSC